MLFVRQPSDREPLPARHDRVNTPAASRSPAYASSTPPPQPIRSILWFTLIGAVVGAAYGHMMAVSDGRPLLGLGGLPRGVLTGVVISTLFFSSRSWRGLGWHGCVANPFSVHLAMKTAIYLVVILFGLSVGGWVFPSPAEVGLWFPIQRQDVLFSFAAVLGVRFVDDINHLLGQNVLLNFITGRYYRPRLEQRVFLFIDIEGSTALAERLGELAFIGSSTALSSISPTRSWRPMAKSTDMSAMS